jgi:hypothetical protein
MPARVVHKSGTALLGRREMAVHEVQRSGGKREGR